MLMLPTPPMHDCGGAQHVRGRGQAASGSARNLCRSCINIPTFDRCTEQKKPDAVVVSLLQALQEMRRQGYIKGGTADCSIVGFGERWCGGLFWVFGLYCP